MAPSGWSSIRYMDNGSHSLAFRLYTPAPSAAPLPLWLWLHGGVHAPRADTVEPLEALLPSLLERGAQVRFPCYILQPMAMPGTNFVGYYRNHPRAVLRLRPHAEDSLQRAIHLLDVLLRVRAREIDPARVMIAGASMGAYGVWDLLVRFPHRFAAAVAVAGGGDPTHPNLRVLRERIAMRKLRVWAFHSSVDRIVTANASRTMVHALAETSMMNVRIGATWMGHAAGGDLPLIGGQSPMTRSAAPSVELYSTGGCLVYTEFQSAAREGDVMANSGRGGSALAPTHSKSFALALGDSRIPGWAMAALPEGDWDAAVSMKSFDALSLRLRSFGE